MTNSQIAKVLNLTATLLELHEGNVFKIRALQTGALGIESIDQPLHSLTPEELAQLESLGKSIAGKVAEINSIGSTAELDALLKDTPPGVLEMLEIKGMGAKKIRMLWKELNIETIDRLLEACETNEVASLKGFGEKTQDSIKQNILYLKSNAHLLRYDRAETIALGLAEFLKEILGVASVEIAGEIARKLEIIESIQLVVVTSTATKIVADKINEATFLKPLPLSCGPFVWRGVLTNTNTPVEIKFAKPEMLASTVYLNSAAHGHLTTPMENGKTVFQTLYKAAVADEAEVSNLLNFPYIMPELREGLVEFELLKSQPNLRLLSDKDLRGVLHNHSKYSDGSNTIEEMAQRCIALGYEYFGIADHSKSGNFYNNGMYENKVAEQQREIDELNKKLAPFRIFKGIEVDILSDGALDYNDEVMASFDYVVASIHSNLKMDVEKATSRTIKAIEHPSTTILGHASGRLLLKREGFPLHYKKVIDACAANEVGIEINANPHRLDLDWRQVIYALEKGVLISINPDAHNLEGIEDIKYGVNVGRKAGLTAARTLNAMDANAIHDYFIQRKKRRGV